MAENDETLKIIKVTIMTLVVLPNFVGNTLVCVVVKRDKSYQTFTNFLLVHLAVTDILTGICSFSELFLDKSTVSSLVCRLFSKHTIVLLGTFTSALIIITISIYRYLGIVKPLKSMQYGDVRFLKFIVPLTWLVSLAGMFPRFQKSFSSPECVDLGSKYALGGVNFMGNLLGFLFGFVIPVVILGYLMWKISRALRTRWKPLTMNSTGTDARLKTRRKAIRRLCYVILIFCVSVLPYQAVTLLVGIFNIETSFWGQFAGVVSECILIAGSSINPFLFWISNQKFRRSALEICRKSNRVQPMGMTQPTTKHTQSSDIARPRRE